MQILNTLTWIAPTPLVQELIIKFLNSLGIILYIYYGANNNNNNDNGFCTFTMTHSRLPTKGKWLYRYFFTINNIVNEKIHIK